MIISENPVVPIVTMSKKKRFLMKCLYYSGFNWVASIYMRHSVFIIGYHSIGALDRGLHEDLYPHITVAVETFARQIEYLSAHGHTFVPMSRLLEPEIRTLSKPTVVYFDDAFKNVLVNALPILKRYRIPANVFVTSGIIDGIPTALPDFSSMGQVTPEMIRQIYLSWDEIRSMRREGIEFGAHGLTHAKLNRCSSESLQEELVVPRDRIKQESGSSPDTLAYPHGRFSQVVINAAKAAGYKLAVTTLEGRNTHQSIKQKPFELRKIAPRPPDTFLEFKVKVYGWTAVSGLFLR
jgi:peptidoglycan/xylan/chitin deacetylase (PgdA/CDA1 family)